MTLSLCLLHIHKSGKDTSWKYWKSSKFWSLLYVLKKFRFWKKFDSSKRNNNKSKATRNTQSVNSNSMVNDLSALRLTAVI